MQGYAEVLPYWGCYEILDALAPLLIPMASGAGFGLFYLMGKAYEYHGKGDLPEVLSEEGSEGEE